MMSSCATLFMSRVRIILWIALLCSHFVPATLVRGQMAEFDKNEVKGRLVRSQEKLEQLLSRMRGEATLSLYTDQQKLALILELSTQAKAEKKQRPVVDYSEQDLRFDTLIEQSRFTFAYSDDRRKFLRENQLVAKLDRQKKEYIEIPPQPSKATGFAHCQGPSHTFDLRYFAGKETPDLVSLQETSKSSDPENLILSQNPDPYIFAPIKFVNMRLRNLIEHPSFDIRGIVSEERDGLHLIRVVFVFDPKLLKPPLQNDPRSLVKSGSLLVDPDRDFLVREIATTNELYPSGTRMRIAYASTPDGAPIPIQVDYLMGIKIYKFTIDKLVYGPTPDSEFTLAAFGLPEPGGSDAVARKRGLAMPYMLGLAALACLVTAFGLRYLSKRVGSNPSPTISSS